MLLASALSVILAASASGVPSSASVDRVPPSGSHADSMSASLVTVTGARVTLELRCQILSLAEVVPGLAPPGLLPPPELFAELESTSALLDTGVNAERLAGFEQQILEYVAEHYRLTAYGRSGSVLNLVGVSDAASVRLVLPEDLEAGQALPGDLVDVRMAFEAPESLDQLVLDVDLFLDTSPGHKDLACVRWNDRGPVATLFDAFRPRFSWPPARRGLLAVAGTWGSFGARRFFESWTHAAFGLGVMLLSLLGLSRESRRLWRALGLLSLAWTLGFAAGGAELLAGETAQRFVAIACALSVAYIGLEAWLQPGPPRALEVALFGLLHGALERGFLTFESTTPALGDERDVVLALGAHLAGGLVCLGLVAAVVRVAWRPDRVERDVERAGGDGDLAPPRSRLRRALAGGLVLAGGLAFILRAFPGGLL